MLRARLMVSALGGDRFVFQVVRTAGSGAAHRAQQTDHDAPLSAAAGPVDDVAAMNRRPPRRFAAIERRAT
jgi:hypothetical protein